MDGNGLLQLFIFLQVFLIGLLATLVVRHGYIHFRPRKKHPQVPTLAPKTEALPQEIKARMIESSQKHFEEALGHSIEKMHKDLEVTTQHINNLVMRVATEIVSGELERYRTEFTQLHKQAAAGMSGIKEELAKHRAEIETKLAEEVEAEKKKLLAQIDTKLGDAMASFLLEALQHNVDLGNQGQYLVAMLEEHKTDFKKEVTGETEPPK